MDSRISDDELVERYIGRPILTHLARTPIGALENSLQRYVSGFSIGGRPNGLWVGVGGDWLRAVKHYNVTQYPLCCYVYEITLRQNANVFYVRNAADFADLDARFPSYWINMDYFDLDYTDKVTGTVIKWTRLRNLRLDQFKMNPNESFVDFLVRLNVMFRSTKAARAGSSFYKKTKMNMEHFRFKDWAAVAREYQGIIVENWGQDPALMVYLWYQSLDVSSGCIWDCSVIQDYNMTYYKVGTNVWMENKPP